MCGIAGWIEKGLDMDARKNVLENMSRTLARRGPDDSGMYIEPGAALIHRRLAVVDPENGKQPMIQRKNGNTYVLVYNGELYNTKELRRELEIKGHRLQTKSDTEILFESLLEWGENVLQKLNGIYAFAFWDVSRKRLFAARDRIGVKPFFFFPYEDGLIFGSEIKTLLANPLVKPEIDMDGLRKILLLGPGRPLGSGVYKGIRELEPGQCMVYEASELSIRTYWKLETKEHTDTEKETVEHTRELLKDSIRRQLISDVPLCCLLSGGLDSSIICWAAAQEYENMGQKLHTYSVDYRDNARYFEKNAFQPERDTDYIQIMGEYIHSEHHSVVIENEALADALAEAVYCRDLPGMADVDSSFLLLAKEVRKEFTVALSGECADELFGGYPWYHRKDILFADTFPWSRSANLRLSVLKPGALGSKAQAEEFIHSYYKETISRAESIPGEDPIDTRMREMFQLNFRWFMQCLLDRKDRTSMYTGLEMRVPFCDHRLAEYAYNMPWKYKALRGREKGIVRAAFEGLLPEKILWRKKSPYPKTYSPVYFSRVREMFRRDVAESSSSPLRPLLEFSAIENLGKYPDTLPEPWYGQLMGVPQIFAYLWQVDHWLRQYKVQVV